jgi:hypothetical protein
MNAHCSKTHISKVIYNYKLLIINLIQNWHPFEW